MYNIVEFQPADRNFDLRYNASVGVVSPVNLTLILSFDFLSRIIWTLIVLLPFSNLLIHCKVNTVLLVLRNVRFDIR